MQNTRFELEILGSRGGCPHPDNPCAGYLLHADQTSILFECGPGIAGRVWPRLRVGGVHAVVISHMHGDHFMDLVPLTYGFLGEHAVPGRPLGARPELWLPPGGRQTLRSVALAFGFAHIFDGPGHAHHSGVPLIDRYFAIHEYTDASTFTIGSVRLRSAGVPHTIDSYAVRAEHDEHSLVYSGDTSGGPALIELAQKCDLLLCEASSVDEGPALPPGHLTSAQTGQIAQAAGCARLVMTHVIEYDATEEALVGGAARAFQGPASVARPGQRYDLAGRLK